MAIQPVLEWRLGKPYLGDDSAKFVWDQSELRALRFALKRNRVLVVSGREGVGKTSLLCACLSTFRRCSGSTFRRVDCRNESGHESFRIADLDRGGTPPSASASPFARLMKKFCWPFNVLVIDHVEEMACWEEDGPSGSTFTSFVHDLRSALKLDASLKIVFLARTGYLGRVEQLIEAASLRHVGHFEVHGRTRLQSSKLVAALFHRSGLRKNPLLMRVVLDDLKKVDFDLCLTRIVCTEMARLGEEVGATRQSTKLIGAYLDQGRLSGLIGRHVGRSLLESSSHENTLAVLLEYLSERSFGADQAIEGESRISVLYAKMDGALKQVALMKASEGGILRRFYVSESEGGKTFKTYRFLHPLIARIVRTYFDERRDVELSETVFFSIVDSVTKTDVWRRHASLFFAADTLDYFARLHRGRLGDLSLVAREFLFNSAVYGRCQTLPVWIECLGERIAMQQLEQVLEGGVEEMQIAAAYAAGEMIHNAKHAMDSLEQLLLRHALENPAYQVRQACAKALARTDRRRILPKIRAEIDQLPNRLSRFITGLASAVLSLLLPERYSLEYSAGRHQNILNLVSEFQPDRLKAGDVPWLARRRSFQLWFDRQTDGRRNDLHRWITRGRRIGFAFSYQWLFSVGLLGFLLLANIYAADVAHRTTILSAVAVISIAALTIVGIVFGRSFSRSAFLQHVVLGNRRRPYLHYFSNPIYRNVLFILILFAVLTIAKNSESSMLMMLVAMYILFWLLMPLMSFLLRWPLVSSRRLISIKCFIGAAAIVLFGAALGQFLTDVFSEQMLYYQSLVLGFITSLCFSVSYATIELCIMRADSAAVSAQALKIRQGDAVALAAGLVPFIVLGSYFSSMYGFEAVIGTWNANAMQFDARARMFSVTDNYDKGINDTNYYAFDVPGKRYHLITMPGMRASSLQPNSNSRISFDGVEGTDLLYAYGDAYVIAPGRHVAISRSTLMDTVSGGNLSFNFKVSPLDDAFLDNEDGLDDFVHMSGRLAAIEVNWKKARDSGRYTATIAGRLHGAEPPSKVRFLKKMFSDDLPSTAMANIMIMTEQAQDFDFVYIAHPKKIESVPGDNFYYAERGDLELRTIGDRWFLDMSLVSNEIAPEVEHFRSIIFIDVQYRAVVASGALVDSVAGDAIGSSTH